MTQRYDISFQDFVGRLSSEKQPDNADAENAELERGLISDVSEVEADRIAVTITTEGSPYLGETATCSRLVVGLSIERTRLKGRPQVA